MDFSQRLKELREVNNITQETFAKFLGVARPTVAGYKLRVLNLIMKFCLKYQTTLTFP